MKTSCQVHQNKINCQFSQIIKIQSGIKTFRYILEHHFWTKNSGDLVHPLKTKIFSLAPTIKMMPYHQKVVTMNHQKVVTMNHQNQVKMNNQKVMKMKKKLKLMLAKLILNPMPAPIILLKKFPLRKLVIITTQVNRIRFTSEFGDALISKKVQQVSASSQCR